MAHYYLMMEADPALGRIYVKLADIVAAYTAAGNPVAAARAEAVLRKMSAEFTRLGTRGAAKGTELIRQRLRITSVRPPTSGILEGAITSRPLPSFPPAGNVGVADMDELDRQVVNPRTGGTYWRAQEYGLPVSYRGKPAPGFFMPGRSRPSMNEFQNHPYFEQMPYARGMPALVRTRDVPARHYLRDGSKAYEAWHIAEQNRIKAEAVKAVLRI